MSERNNEVTKKERRAKWLGFTIVVVVSLVFVAGVAWYSFQLSSPDTEVNTAFYELEGLEKPPVISQRMMSSLSDGFFIIGVLLTSIGCLTWISSTGFFDMLFYGFQGLASLIPFKAPKKRKAFYDYKTERAEKRKSPLNTALIVGMVYLLIAVVFTVLFYNV